MIKKLFLCIAVFGMTNSFAASSARGGVKLDLANSLVQLMIKCLDYKLENEMFRDALEKMRELLRDLGCSAREKEMFQQKIQALLTVMAAIDTENADSYCGVVASLNDAD
jgi:hypothetical protein